MIPFYMNESLLAQDVAPLDVPELLASLVKQSGPLLDQLGVRKGKVKLPWFHAGKFFFIL